MIHERQGEEAEVLTRGRTQALEWTESQAPGAKENPGDYLAEPFQCTTQLVSDRNSI